MTQLDLHGVIPPLVTPLTADGAINYAAFAPLVEHVLSHGVHGIFWPGSQSEAYALTADERQRGLEALLAAVIGRVPVIAGTGAITTRDAISYSRQAEKSGADAVAILTPFFIAPTQEELRVHYHDVAEHVNLPILGYSNPSRTGGLRLTPSTLGTLAQEIPHFIGVKDSSGDLAESAAIIAACPKDFLVFVGRDTLIYGALCHGAAGTVALTANVAPGILVSIYEAFQAGDHDRARVEQARLATLRNALPNCGTYPSPVKEALNLMGLPAGPTRKPISMPGPDQRERLRTLLASLDLLPQNS